MDWRAEPVVWHEATERPKLRPGQPHVWRIDLAESSAPNALLRLSPDEQVRAASMSDRTARHRFVQSHATLRGILAAYSGVPPLDIPMATCRNGKPTLRGPIAGLDLRFSLSHTEDMALLAVAWGHDIGVDIEWIGRDVAWQEFAKRVYSPAEQAALAAAAPENTPVAFAIWTCKEALIKARGGLLWPDVKGIDSDDEARADGMRTFTFEPAPGYVASLAAPDTWNLPIFWKNVPEPQEKSNG